MKTNTETYKVLIHGDEYQLVSDESHEHVLKAAERVDALVRELNAQASHIDKRRVALLAALQLASELVHAQDALSSHQEKEDALVALIDTTVASL